MRIALANWTRRLAGGQETYTRRILQELTRLGHEPGLFYEMDEPPAAGDLLQDLALPGWPDLDALRAWLPDVIYSQGIRNRQTEMRLLEIAPAVIFLHNYFGACISGEKQWSFPRHTPCHRNLGPGCLFHYFPHRCGGLNPLTMVRLYKKERQQQALLHRYRALVVGSRRMEEEYRRHGFGDRVRLAPLFAPDETPAADAAELAQQQVEGKIARLLYLGRMEKIKGGSVLLEALPLLRDRLVGKQLHLTLAGGGEAQPQWQHQAERLSAAQPDLLQVEWAGWVDRPRRDALLRQTNLLVVPSVWPEPFGLVGLEAARFAVPAAGFAIGGIPDWLQEGVNGALAPGDHPTAAGLAEAIWRCLSDEKHYLQLRQGALRQLSCFTVERHLQALLPVLENFASIPA